MIVTSVPSRAKAGFGEARDRRHRSPGTGGDHRTLEAESRARHLDRVRSGEAATAQKDVDTVLVAEPAGRVVGTDLCPDPAHPVHDRGKIDSGIVGYLHAEARGGANVEHGTAGADHGLRRHAADVEAVAAHQVTLDEGDLGPHPGGPGGTDQTGGPGTDDDQVVPALRLGVDPVGRVDVGDQLPVVLVVKGDFRRRGHRGLPGRCFLETPRIQARGACRTFPCPAHVNEVDSACRSCLIVPGTAMWSRNTQASLRTAVLAGGS
jgi:hypothetical protein